LARLGGDSQLSQLVRWRLAPSLRGPTSRAADNPRAGPLRGSRTTTAARESHCEHSDEHRHHREVGSLLLHSTPPSPGPLARQSRDCSVQCRASVTCPANLTDGRPFGGGWAARSGWFGTAVPRVGLVGAHNPSSGDGRARNRAGGRGGQEAEREVGEAGTRRGRAPSDLARNTEEPTCRGLMLLSALSVRCCSVDSPLLGDVHGQPSTRSR
jgi:hypothetical protein